MTDIGFTEQLIYELQDNDLNYNKSWSHLLDLNMVLQSLWVADLAIRDHTNGSRHWVFVRTFG